MTCAQAPGPEFRKPKRISFSELRLDLNLDLDLDLDLDLGFRFAA